MENKTINEIRCLLEGVLAEDSLLQYNQFWKSIDLSGFLSQQRQDGE